MSLFPVPADALPRVWGRVLPWVAMACARTGCAMTPEDMRRACETGEALLLVVLDACGRSCGACILQPRHEGERLTCWILAGGGVGQPPWRDALGLIEDFAREAGCESVEFVGRRGWARALPAYRAEACEAGTHYRKDLR